MISNVATIEHYEVAISGMQMYYENAKDLLQQSYPQAKLLPPVKLQLNTHNITDVQKAILDTYMYDEENNVYSQMRKSPFWSLMHDGISKFGIEYNGVCLRALDEENHPISIPYCLQQMRGGVTGIDTAHAIIDNIVKKIGSSPSAFDDISSYVQDHQIDSSVIVPKPPTYFKMGKLAEVKEDEEPKEIHINLNHNMPISNAGDGVSVNIKGARVLRDFYGFHSPDYRCAVHAANGTLKRLATSKTMNVEEVTVLYECLRTVIKHSELSIKNKVLDECMEILDMMSPIHLISWCQTRMAHFLTSCSLVNESLPALYDAMYTKDIRKHERDPLFTANNVLIIKFLADIEPSFQKLFLRKADKTDCLVSTVYHSAHAFAEKMENIDTPNVDSFQDSLEFDVHGNLLAQVKIKENTHTLMLNHPHKRSRNLSEDHRLLNIKNSLTSLKERIIQNMVQNIRSQCSEDTYYYSWSGFDLEIPGLSIEDRMNRMQDIFTIYCTEKTHLVSTYSNRTETQISSDQWFGYDVYLHYRKQIECDSVEDLKEQARRGLEAVSPPWLAEVLFCQLLQIMITTSSNTSPLERSYTNLQMVAEKRRNRVKPANLEVRYLIAALKVPVKKADQYGLERERLEKL